MIKVLFLSQWYPHRYDSMEGLFVQKHAEAVSHYCEVKVLFVYSDKNIKHFEIIENQFHNVNEVIVYYPTTKYRFLHKIVKSINYLRAYYKGYKLLTRKNFKPDIVHVNVLTRTGLMAYFLNVFKRIPYVVTEHWTRYLINGTGYKGIIQKKITRLVVHNAKAVLPVSKELMFAMQRNKLCNPNYKVVYNVVDDCFFKNYTNEFRNKKRILNVTCFFEQQKNIFGLLRVIKKISEQRNDFELILIGTGKDFEITFQYAKSLNFENGIVNFVGLKTSEEVAEIMSNVDMIVQFSNYETAGVVIAESLVSGKPVLSTNTGITTECINKHNGYLVNAGDEAALYTYMNDMLDNIDKYDKEIIQLKAQNLFSADTIGLILKDIYSLTINHNN